MLIENTHQVDYSAQMRGQVIEILNEHSRLTALVPRKTLRVDLRHAGHRQTDVVQIILFDYCQQVIHHEEKLT